jgi:hypothetical protein
MKKYAKILLLVGAFVFVTQASITPLIHNHPEDLHSHYDCPAYILSVTLQSFAFSIIMAIALAAPFFRRLPIAKNNIHLNLPQLFYFSNRAPPLELGF